MRFCPRLRIAKGTRAVKICIEPDGANTIGQTLTIPSHVFVFVLVFVLVFVFVFVVVFVLVFVFMVVLVFVVVLFVFL